MKDHTAEPSLTSNVQNATDRFEPSGRALARAGWFLLAFILVEVLSRIPLTTFVWNSAAYTLPLINAVVQFFSTHFPPPILTSRAAHALAIDAVASFSYLFFTILCLALVRFTTKSSVPMGRAGIEAVYWILAAIVALYALRIAISIPDYLAGNIVVGDFLGAACLSITVTIDETTSLTLFIFSILLTIVVSPFCEEVLYRGVLVKGFLPAIGVVSTGIVTSALFSLNHFEHSPDLVRYVAHFVTGLGLFAARIRFGGIGVPLALHMVINSVITFEALIKCS